MNYLTLEQVLFDLAWQMLFESQPVAEIAGGLRDRRGVKAAGAYEG
jgi:hypothetical protein